MGSVYIYDIDIYFFLSLCNITVKKKRADEMEKMQPKFLSEASGRILYEWYAILIALYKAREGQDDPIYSHYNNGLITMCGIYLREIDDMFGFNGDIQEHISSLEISDKQQQLLEQRRRSPLFKKILGEYALRERADLSAVLGGAVDPRVESGVEVDDIDSNVAFKTEEQLREELTSSKKYLSELLAKGNIKPGVYNRLNKAVEAIYTYYISGAKGEQIPFRRYTNQYWNGLEEKAAVSGESANDLYAKESERLLREHKERQARHACANGKVIG